MAARGVARRRPPGVRGRRARGPLGGARVDRPRPHPRRPGRRRDRPRGALAARPAARLRRGARGGAAPLPDPERRPRAHGRRGARPGGGARDRPPAGSGAGRLGAAGADGRRRAERRRDRRQRGRHFLGDDAFEPFWAAAEETSALVFIHPTTRGFDAPVFQEHYLWNAVGNPLETTVSAAHLVMTGTMERHPRLKVLLAHGGGAILALRRPPPACPLVPAAGAIAAARVARGVAPPLPLRHGRPRHASCCARWWRRSAPTACCAAPTTRSTWVTCVRPTACGRRASIPATRRRCSGATPHGCSACRCRRHEHDHR